MTNEVARIIGATPLVKLEALSRETGMEVFAKFEAANPGGSIKDRAALSMVNEAEARGDIAPGRTTIVEPTSGNTGIALAMIGAARGYEVVIVMPDTMSRERRMLMTAYGARLELTPGAAGMAGAVERAEEIARETPGAWVAGQFTNPDNPLAHERTTGPEIVEQLGGCFPDFVVTGAGTGGTISGVAHYLRAQGAPTRFFAVEPMESQLIAQALAGEKLKPAPHGIQGIGANFVPDTLDLSVLEGTVPVATADALDAARNLAEQEGLLAGISSGANAAAIARFALEHPEAKGDVVVTFVVDTGERYLSTPLFE
ncbi:MULTISPECIES: cysteine synthase A [Gordonibacter]|uniref:Cysteine synthase n=1 Tax=Gordonibacter faecis TaxID=3047475 RepID=A0ABT7DKV6_9ACTN|nr:MULTISPECIES: cysteine synthase A [unclassified Gordonibacter]MDJ1650166.1 cysteine synthase A [Gordonibacter sp. KGMB12511]